MSDFHIKILHFPEKTSFVEQGLYILIDLNISCFLWRNLLGMECEITMYEEEQNSEFTIGSVDQKSSLCCLYERPESSGASLQM